MSDWPEAYAAMYARIMEHSCGVPEYVMMPAHIYRRLNPEGYRRMRRWQNEQQCRAYWADAGQGREHPAEHALPWDSDEL